MTYHETLEHKYVIIFPINKNYILKTPFYIFLVIKPIKWIHKRPNGKLKKKAHIFITNVIMSF